MGSLIFLDSLQFLNASLDRLVNNLSADGAAKFSNTAGYMCTRFPNVSKENHGLLLRKGVYPYDYVDAFEKFEETSLPSKEAFYNTLTEEDISDEDYEHAQLVWQTFEVKNLGDYHDLYLETGNTPDKTNVLLYFLFLPLGII